MSDNLGNNQLNVLGTEYRNWEEVIYQKRKPPLSSEMNLNGRVSSKRGRELASDLMPSGWLVAEGIKDNVSETDCTVGTILCSPELNANTFKLIALDRGAEEENLVAYVNGMRVLVQGTSSSDENNIVILPEPPTVGNRVDFVFLEVWRKLIRPEDVVYKHGNVLYGGTNPANDLIDTTIGVETNIRIQVQYRIRVANTDIETYPDGFDPNNIFARGPMSSPISCSTGIFYPVSNDPGLWRAGLGDTASQDALGTVDGYIYAIPICAVSRRNSGDFDPDTKSNGAGRNLANYWNRIASDRPDNYYSDWIVRNDILDMRSLSEPQVNYSEICADGLKKLITGQIRGVMEKSTLGEDHFGPVLVEADAVSNVDKLGSNKIAAGDGIRRYFSNATGDQPEAIQIFSVNDKTLGTPGVAWADGDQVQINLSSYPAGSQVLSIEERSTNVTTYTSSQITNSTLPNGVVTLTMKASAAGLVLTTNDFRVEYTIQYPSGPYGLTALPDSFLEVRKEDSTASIAFPGNDIRVRDMVSVQTLDGTFSNVYHNAGARITEQYDFGHQMKFYTKGNGTENVVVPRHIEGHDILGIMSARVINEGTFRSVSITRNASQYTVGLGSPAVPINDAVELVLYTSAKFFEGSKQGRGITDSFEMVEITPIEPADSARTTFHVDTTNQTILALGSNVLDNGAGFAYVDGVRTPLETNNNILPLDTTKSRIEVEFSVSNTPDAGATIEIPILKRAAVGDSEGYTFFYHKTPYQGLLDSTVTGRIEAVGPALVTTAGSGTVTNQTYSTGSVALSVGDSTVSGTGTDWVSNVHSGDILRVDSLPEKEYLIDSIYDATTLFLHTPAEDTVSGGYTIESLNQPNFGHPNIIDRLPALYANADASGLNEWISTPVSESDPVLDTNIISSVQDITDMSANSAIIGVNPAERGRSTVYLEGALGRGNMGLKFGKLDSTGQYQKTYQSYVLNKDNDGRLYLMVVGSETDNDSSSNFFNHTSDLDVVDLFQLPGRMITKRRIG